MTWREIGDSITIHFYSLKKQRRRYEGHNITLGCYTDQGSEGHSQYDGQGEYCDPHTASEVFLIFTTQLYQYLSVFILFALLSDGPEVFLPKYSLQQYFMLLTSGG